MRKLLVLFLTIACLTAFSSPTLFAKIKIGEEVHEKVVSPHPYKGGGGVVWEKTFYWPEAGYIAIHLSKFDLAPGDYLEISSPDGKFVYTFREKGKVVMGGKEVISEFWATHIPGDMAVAKLVSRNPKGGWGFEIDKWARGYENNIIQAAFAEMGGFEDAWLESICGTDDKEWAPCYNPSTMYDKARAVCRLFIGGTSACTGWLLGSEGHVMTNNHCIENQTDASNTDFEFMAEGATCSTGCSSWGACPGTVEASSGVLEAYDYDLDYSLVLLPSNVTSSYGYMQFRNSLPTINERIYIPQHPNAYGKQIAVYSTDSHDESGYCEVYSTNETPCIGGPGDIGYFADTAGGSSGSPVLANADHLVVSLHHCAACPNRGLPIPSIISDLGSTIPNDAIGGAQPDPPAAPTNLNATAAACDQINLTWTDNADNEASFRIERGTNGINFNEIDSVGANITAYSDTTAAENTTYYYRVKARNSAGDSGYTNVDSATTPVCPPEPPAAPTLTAKAWKYEVMLTWTDNSDNEDGFKIYKSMNGVDFDLLTTVGADVTTYTDSGLTRKTRYYYKVCAFNSYGEGCSDVLAVRTK